MNFTKGVTLANTVISKLGTSGRICVYSNVATDVVVDVSGSLSPTTFVPLGSPKRIADSRNPGGNTDDGTAERFGRLAAGTTKSVRVFLRVGLIPYAPSVALSVAAVAPASDGFLTVYPCGSPRPLASSMNFTKGVTIANTVITRIGGPGTGQGDVCVYTSAATDIVLDASGSVL
jgi:hypothetical protein